ncbi:MAG: hypothetical protein AAGA86_07265, partial [Bacteroidota bacterium]
FSNNSFLYRIRTKFYNRLGIILSSCCLIFSLACGDDDEFDPPLEGDELSIAEISGSWISTFVGFQDIDVPQGQEENIDYSALGATVTLNIENNGRFTSRFSLPQGSVVDLSGQMGFNGLWLAILLDSDSPGDEAQWNITLDTEGTLMLSGEIELDFDEDGTDDVGFVGLRMERQ